MAEAALDYSYNSKEWSFSATYNCLNLTLFH